MQNRIVTVDLGAFFTCERGIFRLAQILDPTTKEDQKKNGDKGCENRNGRPSLPCVRIAAKHLERLYAPLAELCVYVITILGDDPVVKSLVFM